MKYKTYYVLVSTFTVPEMGSSHTAEHIEREGHYNTGKWPPLFTTYEAAEKYVKEHKPFDIKIRKIQFRIM